MSENTGLRKLDLYIDDRLEHEERLQFEHELAENPELSRELAERRQAMDMLHQWSEAPSGTSTAGRSANRFPLTIAVIAAAAALLLSVLPLVQNDRNTAGSKAKEAAGLTMRSLEDGTEIRSGNSDVPELTVDPFPVKWRTLKQGVKVIESRSGEAETLIVDPFPEEDRKDA